jgi:hypothetical protein
MDEARALIARLGRIEALEPDRTPAGVLLAELRRLLVEAEAWVWAERPGARAEDAVARCRLALDAAPGRVAMM